MHHNFFRVLNYIDQFIIPFRGLGEGVHNFDFIVNSKFFEHFENSEIKQGELSVKVILHKSTAVFTWEFIINGYVEAICDRCLENVNLPIEYTGNLYVKLGKEYLEESDNMIIISEASNDLNIAQYIYEFVNLSVPMKKVHPEDAKGKSGCNKTMLKKIKELHTRKNDKSDGDPRWDVLKKLKEKK